MCLRCNTLYVGVMYLYKSVYEYGEAEYVIEKSRFIAHVKPVESYEEAQKFVSKIKQEYKNASHNVPAIICGNKQEMQWASDDGEPSGTSGLPVLKMLADEELTNLVIVITRYFGGIKLGTGGLARAYTTAAKLGIEAAGKCQVCESSSIIYELDYSFLAKLQNVAKDGCFEIVDTQFTDKVTVNLECMIENTDEVKKMVMDLTSGQAVQKSEKNSSKRFKI